MPSSWYRIWTVSRYSYPFSSTAFIATQIFAEKWFLMSYTSTRRWGLIGGVYCRLSFYVHCENRIYVGLFKYTKPRISWEARTLEEFCRQWKTSSYYFKNEVVAECSNLICCECIGTYLFIAYSCLLSYFYKANNLLFYQYEQLYKCNDLNSRYNLNLFTILSCLPIQYSQIIINE